MGQSYYSKKTFLTSKLMVLCGLAGAMGCVVGDTPANEEPVDDDVPVGTVTSDITNGQPAQAWMQERAVSISTGCTGTIISNKHILTAAHCKPVAGSTTVRFYNNSTTPSLTTFGISDVRFRPGVNPFTDTLTDINGDFADIAIITLTGTIPVTSRVSPLAIFYPGSDGSGIQVGQGNHDGLANPNKVLRWAFNGLYSDDNSVGFFYTNDDRVNPGDSGGPIYTNGELQGALWGRWFVAFATRNKYTAVSYYLPWILGVIGYQGSFSQIASGVLQLGTQMDALVSPDLNTCKLFCMQSSGCVAFSHWPTPFNVCTLLSSRTSTLSFPGAVSGIR